MEVHLGFRCVCIENAAELSYSENYLVINSNGVRSDEFLGDVDTLMINSLQVRLSSYLINELSKWNVRVIFNDERKNPCSEVLTFNSTYDSYAKIRKQLSWRGKRKDMLWSRIVKNKIRNQCLHLKEAGKNFNMESYISKVRSGDSSNAEAVAARLYFSQLFGDEFIRYEGDNINAGLNYGYTILLSMVNRVVSSYGYSTKFGIHHDCQTNNFNLSCDVIEPFRVFVDRIVYRNIGSEFGKEYKKRLIGISGEQVLYDGKKYRLDNAIAVYFLDIVKYLDYESRRIGEVRVGN